MDSMSIFAELKNACAAAYASAQAKWVEKVNLKVGDYVKVVRKTGSYEPGWYSDWPQEMDAFLGETCQVTTIYDGCICLKCKYYNISYSFPFFVLEKIQKE